MIDVVIAHKERIVKATNEIVEELSRLQESNTLGKETSLYVKKRVNQIVSDLSVIGGFCGSREKSLVEIMESMVRNLLDIGFAGLIEDWCIMANGIIVDFTKTPFRFVGGEFKVNLRNLEGKIKAVLKRE